MVQCNYVSGTIEPTQSNISSLKNEKCIRYSTWLPWLTPGMRDCHIKALLHLPTGIKEQPDNLLLHPFNGQLSRKPGQANTRKLQETQLSPSDCVMRLVSSNLANYHATVQKLLIRQVLTKPMVWSWRFSWRQCVINKPSTVELCISPVYGRLAVAKFSKYTM